MSLTLLPLSLSPTSAGGFSSFKTAFTIILSILLLMIGSSPTMVGGSRFCIFLIAARFFAYEYSYLSNHLCS